MEEDNETKSTNIRERIAELERFFREADADGGGGLDVEEFRSAMAPFYPALSPDQLVALHMQIDANCDGTVDFNEFMDFELGKICAKEKLNFDDRLFPLPMKTVDSGHYNKIVKLVARPPLRWEENRGSDSQKYIDEEYLSVTSDGVLHFWTDRFDRQTTELVYSKPDVLPFAHKRKLHVSDMAYIQERDEVVIATTDRELKFYIWGPSKLYMKYALVTEGGRVTALNYWSNGKKAIFSFGDLKGFLSVFVSYDVELNGLFNPMAFERIKLENYNRVYMSTLLHTTAKEFFAIQIPVFDEGCSLISFFPSLDEFAVCPNSATKMALIALPKTSKDKVSKRMYTSSSSKKIFMCVDFSFGTQDLVTGGMDGVLRTWYPYKTESCKSQLSVHSKAISHVLDNPKQKVVICLHEDQTICVWSLEGKHCMQMIKADEMSSNRISAVYYDLQNNELVLANTTVGILLGKGTDVFKEMLSSHLKPLCCAIYHNIFNQVVSVCQKGLVTIWDMETGKTVMQFNASPFKLAASTAIGLNEPQRKLITVCNDGRVRFWNFNNGKELEVLPVTVPTMITGIICTEERVFLSAKHSNVIYNLDLDGKDPMFLEHPLAQGGVMSISMHPTDGWIVTASGNGVVIVWDAESYQALYLIDSKESPRIQKITKKDFMGKIGNLPVEKETFLVEEYERIPIPKKLLETRAEVLEPSKVFKNPLVLCLKARSVSFLLATVLVADRSHVSAWSGTMKGGLLARFRATSEDEAEITCVDTDSNDRILMVGDSSGHVQVWDITKFGNRNFECGPFEDIDYWKVCVNPPTLLSRWSAHKGPVMSVTCNFNTENFITTGFDCNVNLWTNKQRKVGTFGKDQWENKELDPDWEPPQRPTEKTVAQDWHHDEQHRKTTAEFWQVEEEEAPRTSEEVIKCLEKLGDFLKSLGRPAEVIQPSNEEAEEIKEIQPPKVRHFLEKRQFRETPLVYRITCPYSGPIGEEQLSEHGNKLRNAQLTLATPAHENKPTKTEKKSKRKDAPPKPQTSASDKELKEPRGKSAKEPKKVTQTDPEDVTDGRLELEHKYPVTVQEKYLTRFKAWQLRHSAPTHEEEAPSANAEEDQREPRIQNHNHRKEGQKKRHRRKEDEKSKVSSEDVDMLQRILAGNKNIKVLRPGDVPGPCRIPPTSEDAADRPLQPQTAPPRFLQEARRLETPGGSCEEPRGTGL